MISTLEQLFELMAQNIEQAQGPMSETERCKLIGQAATAAAEFCLAASPTTGAHRMWLSSELVKNLRGFKAPFFIVSREMADAPELRVMFEHFIEATEGWQETKH